MKNEVITLQKATLTGKFKAQCQYLKKKKKKGRPPINNPSFQL